MHVIYIILKKPHQNSLGSFKDLNGGKRLSFILCYDDSYDDYDYPKESWRQAGGRS
jgi:hypothetical protein